MVRYSVMECDLSKVVTNNNQIYNLKNSNFWMSACIIILFKTVQYIWESLCYLLYTSYFNEKLLMDVL